MSGPAHHAGNANASLGAKALLVAQRPGGAVRMLGCDRGTVVAGENDERGFAKSVVVEGPHQAAESVVQLRDVAVMSAVRRVGVRIEPRVFVVGGDRLVRLVKTDV